MAVGLGPGPSSSWQRAESGGASSCKGTGLGPDSRAAGQPDSQAALPYSKLFLLVCKIPRALCSLRTFWNGESTRSESGAGF